MQIRPLQFSNYSLLHLLHMIVTTRGLVVHTTRYSETSVIARIYTERLGLVSYLVKGVRTARSKSKASMLQPLTLLQMEVLHREHKPLQYIKEFSRAYNYVSLPFDAVKSSVALFILEIISKTVQEQEPNEDLFEFTQESFQHIDNNPLNPDFHLLFMVHFSRYLGFFPQLQDNQNDVLFDMMNGLFTKSVNAYTMPEMESRLLQSLLTTSPFTHQVVTGNRAIRTQMMKALLTYYSLHVENFSLRSPDILHEVLNA